MIPSVAFPDAQALSGKIAFPDAQALSGQIASACCGKIVCVRSEKVDGSGRAADALSEGERSPRKPVASGRFSSERELLAAESGVLG